MQGYRSSASHQAVNAALPSSSSLHFASSTSTHQALSPTAAPPQACVRHQESAAGEEVEEHGGEARTSIGECNGEDSTDGQEQRHGHDSCASPGRSAEDPAAAVPSDQPMEQEVPSAPSQPSHPGEGEDQEMVEGEETTAAELASPAEAHNTVATPTLPSASNAHAQPSGVTQLKRGVHHLDRGLRFDYMLSDTTICVHSPLYWEPIQPALQQVPPGSPQEHAMFVFSVLPDGSLLTLLTPPGTQSHSVYVDENGEEVDRESRMSGQVRVVGTEHRFRTVESFCIVFFEPL